MSQPILSVVHCDTSNSQCDVIPFDAARESLAASSVVCFLHIGDRIVPIDVPPDLLKHSSPRRCPDWSFWSLS